MKSINKYLVIFVMSFIVVPAKASIQTIDYKSKCLSSRDFNVIANLFPRDFPEQLTAEVFQDTYYANPSNASRKSNNAYKKLKIIEAFFQSEFNWSSVDNRSSPILLLTNLSLEPFRCGNGLNAFFLQVGSNGVNIMVILYGHPNASLDIANDLEVVGHEFAHGIFATTQSANDYIEMKAINEGVADMFGSTIRAWFESGRRLSNTRVRQDSFLVGRTLDAIANQYYNARPGKMMRDLLNPNQYDVAGHWSQANTPAYQQEHALSGIVSLAFALMVVGGEHPQVPFRSGVKVDPLGFEKAIRIVFYTLKHRLPFNSMHQFAMAVRKAARKMYGVKSCEFRSVHNAFTEVGLFDQPLRAQCLTQEEIQRAREQAESDRARQSAEEQRQVEEQLNEESQASEGQRQEASDVKSQQQEEQEDQEGENNQALKIEIQGISFIGFLALFVVGLIFFILRSNKGKQSEKSWQLAELPADDLQMKDSARDTLATSQSGDVSKVLKSNASIAIRLTLNGESQIFSLGEKAISIGRESSNITPILAKAIMADASVSRHHCDIWYNLEKEFLYVYNYSANGTSINGHKLDINEKAKLSIKAQATIQVGLTSFEIQLAK